MRDRLLGGAARTLLALALLLAPISPAHAEEVPTEPAPVASQPAPEPATATRSTATPKAAPEPAPEHSETDDPDVPAPAEETPGRYEVADAELRWGVNNESNNRAFAPGTFNFFSAGKIADPGSGGVVMPPSGWKASSGHVAIQKQVGTTYQRATWAGLKTDSTGTTIPNPTSGRFSNHQVVIGGGTGEVDTATGTATIQWDGDFTVLYYSGMSFFYVSDPKLTVVDGKGTVTATLGGFASSMEDLTKWEPVKNRTVTLAHLPTVSIVPDSRGFTAPVAYRGVTVGGDQVTSGPNVGSFPASFVNFQKEAGAAAYWFSSGGSTDAYKAALPMTISYDQGDPIAPPISPTQPATGADEVTNRLVSPPAFRAVGAPPPAAAFNAPAGSAALPPVAATAQAAFAQVANPTTQNAEQASAATATAVWWWIGAILLTLAVGTIAGTSTLAAAASRR